MSSSDTDTELLLFTREHQSGILEVVKHEVGHGCGNISIDLESFTASLVTTDGTAQMTSTDGQAGSAAATASDSQAQPAVVCPKPSHSSPPGSGPAVVSQAQPAVVCPKPSPSSPPGSGPAVVSQAQPAVVCPQPSPSSTPGAVPAVERWPGQHAFCTTVCQRGGAPSGRLPPYAYNVTTGKLYTDLLAAVPFRFAYVSVQEPRELQIRAMPVYCESHHVHTPVRRCAVHRDALHPSNMKVQHVRHVLRAQHPHARYEEEGERCSVTVPLEPLEPDTADYAVLFEFACMNTCVGGMNRRRVMVVFSLEERSSGRTLGRQALEVKVCKCPHRDSRNDDKRRSDGSTKQQCKRPRQATPPPPPAPASETAGVGRLTVTADDEAMHSALIELRDTLRRYGRSVAPPQRTAGNRQQ